MPLLILLTMTDEAVLTFLDISKSWEVITSNGKRNGTGKGLTL
jgi:hypothetical protein